jgi:hypothetical protein
LIRTVLGKSDIATSWIRISSRVVQRYKITLVVG